MSEQNMEAQLYQKIYAIMAELPWIEKDGQVSIGGRGGYAYATEAAFISAIRPLMIKHRLVIIPSGITTDTTTITNDGKTIFATAASAKYKIVDIDTGLYTYIEMSGSGNDSGDKHVYKSLTGAYKYALRQLFMVGTGDDPEGSDEDGNSTSLAPITLAAKKYTEITGQKFDKSIVTLLKDNGFTWSEGFGIEEQKTARKILDIAKKLKSGMSVEESMK